MSLLKKYQELIEKPQFVLGLWIALALLIGIKEYTKNSYNNYKVYTGVFYHTINQQNLYNTYPESYFDVNNYGPIFSLVIAPFALLPIPLGIVLWLLINSLLLFFAISKLPLSSGCKVLIYWLITNELFTSLVNMQINSIIASTIILAYCFVCREKDSLAAFTIVLGFLIKVYSIIGLAFFFFSKNKIKLVGYCLFWTITLFLLPAIISSPTFALRSYADWYNALVLKNVINADLLTNQDISIMGLFRRMLSAPELPSLYFIVPGSLLFFFLYLKFRYFKDPVFQLLHLASALIFVVIFSSSSESPTYIIAFCGIAIWFSVHPRPYPKNVIVLLLFAIVLTSLSPTIFPPSWYGNFVIRYSFKALPCVIIWLYLIYELLRYPHHFSIKINQ